MTSRERLQKTLNHEDPEEVYEETMKNLTIFSKNGGFVFNRLLAKLQN